VRDNRDALDRYLDDLANHPHGSTSELEPDLAVTIRRLSEIGASPSPERTFVDHLEDSLMNAVSAVPAGPSRNAPAARRSARPTSIRQSRSILPQGVVSRLASIALMAAMLMVAISFVSNPLRPVRNWLDDRNQSGGFAIDAPATPLPTKETLLRVELPAESMPIGKQLSAGLAHFTIPPRTRSTWIGNSAPGLLLEYVVEGSYTVESETSFQIVRAAGDVETIAVGVEATLNAGDSWVSRNEAAATASNTGLGPVQLLSWVLVDTDLGFGGHLLPGWIERQNEVRSLGAIPLAPATVRLERIELAPGESTSGSTDGREQFAVVVPDNDAGTPTPLVFHSTTSGDVSNVGETTALVYILTFETGVTGAGTPIAGTPAP